MIRSARVQCAQLGHLLRLALAFALLHAPFPAQADGPGTLVDSAPLASGTLSPGLQGWRISYATTIDDMTPATAVATIFAPDPLPSGPLPVIAWAHGTTGLLARCMPSRFPHPTAGIPALAAAIAQGWAIVATDYAFAEPDGVHPYLIGEGQARAVLDALRAARSLDTLALADETVVWGHSQGGHAALWTGIIAPGYAPDLTLSGVAAIAPAADPAAIFAANPPVDRLLGPYVATAYARFYPELPFTDIVRPGARAATRDISALCAVFPPQDTARLFARAAGIPDGVLALDNPAFAARLAANAATGPIAAPLLLAQGGTDIIVRPAVTETWAAARCAAGQAMTILTFADQDHAGIVLPGAPLDGPLLAWTADRIAGLPAPVGCPVTAN
jgi:hypothetical protein